MFGFLEGLTFLNADAVALSHKKIHHCGNQYLLIKDAQYQPDYTADPQEKKSLIAFELEVKRQQLHASPKDCQPRRPYRPDLRPILETIDEEKCFLRSNFLKKQSCGFSQFKRGCKITLTKLRHKMNAARTLSYSCFNWNKAATPAWHFQLEAATIPDRPTPNLNQFTSKV